MSSEVHNLVAGGVKENNVLSDTRNEISVSDMLCRDNKEVCKYCRENLQY
jgi:hypothetical protein